MKKMIVALTVVLLAAGQLHAGSGDLIVDGKLGVGTAAPQAQVDIAGNVKWGESKGNLSLLDGNPFIGTDASVPLLLVTNGVERMRLNENGKIGIGTATPLYTLHIEESQSNASYPSSIYGKLTVTSTYSGDHPARAAYFRIIPMINDGVTNNGFLAGASYYTNRGQALDAGTLSAMYGTISYVGHSNGTPSSAVTNDVYGNAVWFSNYSGTMTNFYGYYLGVIGGVNTGTVMNRYGVFIADSLAKNYFAGNVGIGTTNPGTYKLYVNGSAYSTGGWQSSDARFKKNLLPISSPVDKVLSLNGISHE